MHEILARLTVALGDPGEPKAARRVRLEQMWESIDLDDHAARCVAAHYIADAQDTLTGEVAWDETALREVELTSDTDLQAIDPSLRVAGFLPSLHLNLADGYRRQGRFEDAEGSLAACAEFDFALDGAGSEYAETVRAGRARLAARIAARDSS
jgi:hypothetical protein